MERNAGIKYFAYMRKSSEDKEKQALSIPAQKDKLIEMFGNLDVVFVEEERSAFVPHNRPKFADMLARIRRGERRGVIAWHPDRLSRNEVDASSLTYMLRTGAISDLKLATYHFENTPEGIWMLQMALSQSQYESAKKGRDVKRGLEKKAKMGTYPAPAPLGYRNDKYEKRGKKQIYTDPKLFPTLRRMVDLMLTGAYTPPQIAKIANEEWGFRGPNGKKIARSSIYNLFTRTFYYGEYQYPAGSGLWYRGVHEPLMTRSEYDRIQFLLGRRGKPRPKAKHHLVYRGPIRCAECGAMITAEEKLKKLARGGVALYTYYHCTKRKDPNCSQRAIEEKELERQLVLELAALVIPSNFKIWALDRLRESRARHVADREHVMAARRREYDACVRRIDTLIDMRANGEIDEHEFRSRKEKLRLEKERLWSSLSPADESAEDWLEAIERGLNFAEKAASAFSRARDENNIAAKREIFAALGSNYRLMNGNLDISLDNLLFPIRKAAEEIRGISSGLEPAQNQGVAMDLAKIYSQNPRLLQALDDVRTVIATGDTKFTAKNEPVTRSLDQDTSFAAAA